MSRSPGLERQFLAWVAARPRTYQDAMDAWRTTCPRLSVWEDVVDAGLVRLGSGADRQGAAPVELTPAGLRELGR